jgi:hypothetical protein
LAYRVIAPEGHYLPHFSEEAIELAAMGRLRSENLQTHLDQCSECTDRVAEHRAWIATLKYGLITFNPIEVFALIESRTAHQQRYVLRIKL